jgi:hypothetical protein
LILSGVDRFRCKSVTISPSGLKKPGPDLIISGVGLSPKRQKRTHLICDQKFAESLRRRIEH